MITTKFEKNQSKSTQDTKYSNQNTFLKQGEDESRDVTREVSFSDLNTEMRNQFFYKTSRLNFVAERWKKENKFSVYDYLKQQYQPNGVAHQHLHSSPNRSQNEEIQDKKQPQELNKQRLLTHEIKQEEKLILNVDEYSKNQQQQKILEQQRQQQMEYDKQQRLRHQQQLQFEELQQQQRRLQQQQFEWQQQQQQQMKLQQEQQFLQQQQKLPQQQQFQQIQQPQLQNNRKVIPASQLSNQDNYKQQLGIGQNPPNTKPQSAVPLDDQYLMYEQNDQLKMRDKVKIENHQQKAEIHKNVAISQKSDISFESDSTKSTVPTKNSVYPIKFKNDKPSETDKPSIIREILSNDVPNVKEEPRQGYQEAVKPVVLNQKPVDQISLEIQPVIASQSQQQEEQQQYVKKPPNPFSKPSQKLPQQQSVAWQKNVQKDDSVGAKKAFKFKDIVDEEDD